MLLRTLVFVAFGVSLAPVQPPRTTAAKPGARVPVRPAKSSGVKRRVKPPTKAQVPTAAAKPKRAKHLRPPKAAFVPCSSALPKQAPGAVVKSKPKKKPGTQALVANKYFLWPVGATLNVSFVDGSMEARKAVAEIANEWSKHANVKFAFFFDSEPSVTHVRVLFDDPNCNSALGTSSQYMIDGGDASMRLCHLDKQVGSQWFQSTVLHEFGHALGMEHEHQSPKAKFDWNKPYVYDYYARNANWDQFMVDHWIFRQIEATSADASDYDPDSVMQYSFPAEFTKSNVAFLGGFELSATDKAHIAKMYPGVKPDPGPKPKPTKFFERMIAVRNDTGVPLDVQLVHESKDGSKWSWAPAADPTTAPSVRVAVGEELKLPGPPSGRRVKLVAKSTDGKKIWSKHQNKPLVIASAKGYRDREPQTWVVAVGGPPDAASLDRDELYAAGSEALASGKYELARTRYGEFVQRFADDELVPWAELNTVIAWTGERAWSDALQAAYDLVQTRAASDASNYALYFGGLSAMQLGKCADAKVWFDFVVDPATGLGQEWQSAAKDNLAEMKTNASTWCD